MMDQQLRIRRTTPLTLVGDTVESLLAFFLPVVWIFPQRMGTTLS